MVQSSAASSPFCSRKCGGHSKSRLFGERAIIRILAAAVGRCVADHSTAVASEIVPGQSFLARDLLRGGEPVLVHEGTATTTLRPWEKIAARIVTVADRNILTGGLLPFSPGATDMLMDAMRQLTGRTKRSRAKLRLENDVLRGGAPLFTIAWLMDALGWLNDQESAHDNIEDATLTFQLPHAMVLSIAAMAAIALRGIDGTVQICATVSADASQHL